MKDYSIAEPGNILLEVSNRCNLRCKMCSLTTEINKGIKPFMDLDVVRRLDSVVACSRSVHLGGIGEPLLNPQFFDIISHLKSVNSHTHVQFVTNGHLIDDEIIDRIFASRVNAVTFSFDGFDVARGHPNPEKVLEVLDAFNAHPSEPDGWRPYLAFATVIGRDNYDQLPSILDICAEKGIRFITIEGLGIRGDSIWRDYINENAAINNEDLMKEPYMAARDYAASKGIKVGDCCTGGILYGDAMKCLFPNDEMYIHANGDISMCRYTLNTGANVMTEDPFDVWNGQVYLDTRKRLDANDFPSGCNNCPVKWDRDRKMG